MTLVATPIGNLGDLSPRAQTTLAGVDLVLCEDTRVTGPLLRHAGVATPMLAYHEHNAARLRPQILARLAKGERMALVSDAGMPLISDPGFKLVRACLDADVSVSAVPGANAALMALALSGLPTDRFFFAGFLPPRSAARRQTLESWRDLRASLIFYESPHRLVDFLEDAMAVLGDRPAAVARELTKKFEEVRRGSFSALIAHYTTSGAPKGEISLVIGPPPDDSQAQTQRDAQVQEDMEAFLRAHLATGTVKEAVAAATQAFKRPRKEVYALALKLTGEGKE